MDKPKIAIVNSSSQLAICFSHLDEIARRAKRAIERAGGVAFEVRTAAPSDFITSAGHRGGYILSARDLITNDIEVAVEGALLDGMLCLASCDKTAPAQLMAAGRLNIPTIIVPCGYQPSGSYRGSHCDIEDVFLAAGHLANGQITLAELTEMSENAVLGPGVCAGMGTANTVHIACEALGMALPGTTPVRANSQPMWDALERACERIVQMVAEDLRPRDILTAEAFANAVMTILSVSGSINSVKHLQAVAAEAECEVDVYRLFEQLADGIPLVTAIRPNGEASIEDFEDAGGARAHPYRQGVPGAARRRRPLPQDGGRGDRRRQRPVRRPPGQRRVGGDRDEPEGVAFLGAGVQGDRLSDRAHRRQARPRLPSRRGHQPDHAVHPGVVPAGARRRNHAAA